MVNTKSDKTLINPRAVLYFTNCLIKNARPGLHLIHAFENGTIDFAQSTLNVWTSRMQNPAPLAHCDRSPHTSTPHYLRNGSVTPPCEKRFHKACFACIDSPQIPIPCSLLYHASELWQSHTYYHRLSSISEKFQGLDCSRWWCQHAELVSSTRSIRYMTMYYWWASCCVLCDEHLWSSACVCTDVFNAAYRVEFGGLDSWTDATLLH